LGANHNHEKRSPSLAFAGNFDIYFLLRKGDFNNKNQSASRTSKKTRGFAIGKTFRSWPTETLRGPRFV